MVDQLWYCKEVFCPGSESLPLTNLFTLKVAYSLVAAMESKELQQNGAMELQQNGAVKGHDDDDDAGSSGDEVDSAELLLNNGSALSAEENEDKTASLTKQSLLKCLQSLWHNRKNVAAVAMLWTALLSTLANKALITSFFPQEVNCCTYS